MNLAYSHVDVFSRVPFGGNGLPVFSDAADLTAEQMLRITKDLRSVRGATLRRAPDHWRGGGFAQTFRGCRCAGLVVPTSQ